MKTWMLLAAAGLLSTAACPAPTGEPVRVWYYDAPEITVTAKVEIQLPANAAFDVDARTRSGAVKVRFPIQASEQESGRVRGRVRGRVGAGGATLTLVSFSGDVLVAPTQ